jgi:4-amino-4-deoxy-L-arabinose transferase-like glycosyltransferase
MVAIPLAGLVGIGTIFMYETYIQNEIRGWLLVLAIIVTGIVQWQFTLYNTEFSGILTWIILIGSISIGLILSILRINQNPVSSKFRLPIIILGVSLLCIAPFIWACTPVFYQSNAAIPVAGPTLNSDDKHFPGMNPGIEGVNNSALYSFLSSHQTDEKYLVGVDSSRSASDLIINYSAPVMAMGGFSGSDNILNLDKLKGQINSHKIRYFLVDQKSPGMPQRQGSNVTSWILDSCQVVPMDEWNTENQSTRQNSALYDCKGVA